MRLDYFNKGEDIAQKKFAAKRDVAFAPIVDLLVHVNVSPAHLSISGVISCALVMLVPSSYWMISVVLIFVYVLLDGIDGPLARKTSGGTPGGALIDIFSDQVGIIFVAVAAITWAGGIPQVHLIFSFAYVFCVFAMVFVNNIGGQIAKTIRVKYFYFLGYIIALATGLSTQFDIVVAMFSVYYILMFIIHFMEIVATLDKSK